MRILNYSLTGIDKNTYSDFVSNKTENEYDTKGFFTSKKDSTSETVINQSKFEPNANAKSSSKNKFFDAIAKYTNETLNTKVFDESGSEDRSKNGVPVMEKLVNAGKKT